MTSEPTPEFDYVEVDDIWDDEPHRPRRAAPSRPERPSIVDLVQSVISEGQTLVSSQIQLFKLKAQAAGKKLGIGIGMVVVAVILAFYLIWWMFHTIEVALSHALPDWASSLIVLGLIIILMVGLILAGVQLAKKANEEKPDVKGLQTDLNAVKNAVKEGKD